MDTAYQKGGQQTGRDEKREPWRRVGAILVSGLGSTPSNNCVVKSNPYQHLRRVLLERRTLFRTKLLSGVHLRTCTCVPL